MKLVQTELPGVVIVEADVVRDRRGFFLETYHATKYRAMGIAGSFVQDNHSRSSRRHFARPAPAGGAAAREARPRGLPAKSSTSRSTSAAGRRRSAGGSASRFRPRVSASSIFPKGSPTGSPWSAKRRTSNTSARTSTIPSSEICMLWSDPALAIKWPIDDPVLSDRDRSAPTVAQIAERLPAYAPAVTS